MASSGITCNNASAMSSVTKLNDQDSIQPLESSSTNSNNIKPTVAEGSALDSDPTTPNDHSSSRGQSLGSQPHSHHYPHSQIIAGPCHGSQYVQDDFAVPTCPMDPEYYKAAVDLPNIAHYLMDVAPSSFDLAPSSDSPDLFPPSDGSLYSHSDGGNSDDSGYHSTSTSGNSFGSGYYSASSSSESDSSSDDASITLYYGGVPYIDADDWFNCVDGASFLSDTASATDFDSETDSEALFPQAKWAHVVEAAEEREAQDISDSDHESETGYTGIFLEDVIESYEARGNLMSESVVELELLASVRRRKKRWGYRIKKFLARIARR